MFRHVLSRSRGRRATESLLSSQQPGWQTRGNFNLPSSKRLDDIVKLALLEREPAEEVKRIWTQHHANSTHHVATTLSAQQFDSFTAHARAHSLFVLPVPKGAQGGFLTFFTQCQLPFVIFTLLDEYMQRSTAAGAHLVVTHYDELRESKGLVLVRGELLLTTELMPPEASTLVERLHSFYTTPDGQHLVSSFNRGAVDFTFDAVLKRCGLPPTHPPKAPID